MQVDQNKLKPLGEFDLIDRYFSKLTCADKDLVLGVGDDAALMNIRANQQLVSSVDTLIADVHFPAKTSPVAIAHRSLAANLSDMAAMGAEPRWCLLSLCLPAAISIDQSWLKSFSWHFAALLKHYHVSLVGGDTTAADQLSISITMLGTVPRGTALLRSGAKVDDDLYVSGFLGEAAAGLDAFLKNENPEERTQNRFLFPDPRVHLGIKLQRIANSCIDISDGLLADAGHIARKSHCNLVIELDKLLKSSALLACCSQQQQWAYMLSGGDDYELCFTTPRVHRKNIAEISRMLDLPLTRIGSVKATTPAQQMGTVICLDENQQQLEIEKKGYQHFVTT